MLFCVYFAQIFSAISCQLFSILMYTEQHSSKSNVHVLNLKPQAFSKHYNWNNMPNNWKEMFVEY